MVVVRQRPPRLLAIIGAAAWLACGEPSPIEAIPSAPQLIADSIAIYPRQVQIDDVGKSQLFSATVLDQNGDAIAVPVTWTTTAPAVATVDGSGLVTAHGAGFAFIHARAGSATDAVPVAVVPPGISSSCRSRSSSKFAIATKSLWSARKCNSGRIPWTPGPFRRPKR
jgi:hypothetical protein